MQLPWRAHDRHALPICICLRYFPKYKPKRRAINNMQVAQKSVQGAGAISNSSGNQPFTTLCISVGCSPALLHVWFLWKKSSSVLHGMCKNHRIRCSSQRSHVPNMSGCISLWKGPKYLWDVVVAWHSTIPPLRYWDAKVIEVVYEGLFIKVYWKRKHFLGTFLHLLKAYTRSLKLMGY